MQLVRNKSLAICLFHTNKTSSHTHTNHTTHHIDRKRKSKKRKLFIPTLLHYYYCTTPPFCSVPTNPSCLVAQPARPINFAGNFLQKGRQIHPCLSILSLRDPSSFHLVFLTFSVLNL